ncbi:MAG: V-type ATPase subunit [Ferroplasma sp.]
MVFINTVYAGSFGRLKVNFNNYLTDEFIKSLLDLNIADIRSKLYTTVYREDIDKSTTISSDDITVLITAINRHIIKNSKLALFAVPPEIKPFIKSYISKWDIESIKAIITSKVIKHNIKYNDTFIVSFRDIPMGIFAGNLTGDDFRIMLEKNDVDAIINYLFNHGYSYLLKELDTYKKTGDISSLLSSMDFRYYNDVYSAAKFFTGDEGALINYIKTEIDLKNMLTLVKGIELNVEFEQIENTIIENGTLSKSMLMENYRSKNIMELLNIFKNFNIEEAIESYKDNKNLSMFEMALRRAIYQNFVPLMLRNTSALYIFAYILVAERERDNLRAIIIGKSYNLARDTMERMLI